MFRKATTTRTRIADLPQVSEVSSEELTRVDGGGRTGPIGEGVLIGAANALGKVIVPTASMGDHNSADTDVKLV